jgi:hypothetical protein
MPLPVVRRPRIVEPRCLRCRRPLDSGGGDIAAEAYCTDCSSGWLEPWEDGNA